MSGYCKGCGDTICRCDIFAESRKVMLYDARWTAYHSVDKMINEGLKKHGKESWRSEPERMHIIKAIGHLVTALRVLDGYSEPDGENHLDNALCRSAFARCQENENGK